MLIKNAIVFDPDRVFRNREINISGEKFVEPSFMKLGFSPDRRASMFHALPWYGDGFSFCNRRHN